MASAFLTGAVTHSRVWMINSVLVRVLDDARRQFPNRQVVEGIAAAERLFTVQALIDLVHRALYQPQGFRIRSRSYVTNGEFEYVVYDLIRDVFFDDVRSRERDRRSLHGPLSAPSLREPVTEHLGCFSGFGSAAEPSPTAATPPSSTVPASLTPPATVCSLEAALLPSDVDRVFGLRGVLRGFLETRSHTIGVVVYELVHHYRKLELDSARKLQESKRQAEHELKSELLPVRSMQSRVERMDAVKMRLELELRSVSRPSRVVQEPYDVFREPRASLLEPYRRRDSYWDPACARRRAQ
eukprot:GFKZ01008074.1.p1 GENE.GFKZ01008074.1~~GFKZ01008074.1.p1  ORF type:complete len:298 (-),score=15.58 GFKZ01008074.1:581-1474(-)